jgi:sensor c-di-GMP phosphodiesterase-like protein
VAFATVANTTVSKGAEILDMLAFFKEYEVAFSFDTIINQDNLKQKIFIEYLNDKLNLRIENEQKVSDTVRTVDKGINPLVKEKPKSFWQKIGDVFIWIFAIALILIIGTLVFKFIYWILFRD